MTEFCQKTHPGILRDTQGNPVLFFGKAEVVSSILTGSTISSNEVNDLERRPRVVLGSLGKWDEHGTQREQTLAYDGVGSPHLPIQRRPRPRGWRAMQDRLPDRLRRCCWPRSPCARRRCIGGDASFGVGQAADRERRRRVGEQTLRARLGAQVVCDHRATIAATSLDWALLAAATRSNSVLAIGATTSEPGSNGSVTGSPAAMPVALSAIAAACARPSVATICCATGSSAVILARQAVGRTFTVEGSLNDRVDSRCAQESASAMSSRPCDDLSQTQRDRIPVEKVWMAPRANAYRRRGWLAFIARDLAVLWPAIPAGRLATVRARGQNEFQPGAAAGQLQHSFPAG